MPVAPPLDLQLRKLDGALRGAGLAVGKSDATYEAAREVARVGRIVLAAAPGRYPKSQTLIEAQRPSSARIVAPWAFGSEYGSNTHHVFGRKTRIAPNPRMHGLWPRRVTVDADNGYVLGQAWRLTRGEVTEMVADDALAQYSRQFDRAGFPKGAV